jgi:hypothetical protein
MMGVLLLRTGKKGIVNNYEQSIKHTCSLYVEQYQHLIEIIQLPRGMGCRGNLCSPLNSEFSSRFS